MVLEYGRMLRRARETQQRNESTLKNLDADFRLLTKDRAKMKESIKAYLLRLRPMLEEVDAVEAEREAAFNARKAKEKEEEEARAGARQRQKQKKKPPAATTATAAAASPTVTAGTPPQLSASSTRPGLSAAGDAAAGGGGGDGATATTAITATTTLKEQRASELWSPGADHTNKQSHINKRRMVAKLAGMLGKIYVALGEPEPAIEKFKLSLIHI